MTVICISAFDKFSRFYLSIGKEMNKKLPVRIRIYSIHFSGFLYPILRLRFGSWIAVKSWALALRRKKYYRLILKTHDSYKGIPIDHCVAFHKRLSHSISDERLRLQSLAYIDLFESIYLKTQPDVLLCLGDTKMSTRVAVLLARKMNIEVRYIEQGPFNRTFFDADGVNANLSARSNFNPKTNEAASFQLQLNQAEKYRSYWRSPIYRICDILLFKLLQQTSCYPPDLKYTDINSLKFRKQPKELNDEEMGNNRFLLICQLPTDVNTVMHSPFFDSQFEILQATYNALPDNSKLVVREHPLCIGKYEPQFYQFINENDITIENSIQLNAALQASKVIIVNNSTVGYEAVCNYKTTVVLGNAFYDHSSLCLKLQNRKDLTILLREALNYRPDKAAIDRFNAYLCKSSLIEGGIKERELRASHSIAERLLSTL